MDKKNIRDEIAINAMVVLIKEYSAENIGGTYHGNSTKIYRRIADSSYKMADAMLEAQKNKHSEERVKSEQGLKRRRRIKIFKLKVFDGLSYKYLGQKFNREANQMRVDCERVQKTLSFNKRVQKEIGRDFSSRSIDLNNTTKNEKEWLKKAIELYEKDLSEQEEMKRRPTPEMTDADLPTIDEWLDMADLDSRSWTKIIGNYLNSNGKDKTMKELINDVRTGKIKKHRGIGDLTYQRIKTALRDTLKIEV